MKKLFYLLFPLLVTSCALEDQKSKTISDGNIEIIEQDATDLLFSEKEPYSISFEINESSENEYDFYISFELDSGVYFASLFSKEHPHERLEITIEENNAIQVDTIWVETIDSKNNSLDTVNADWVRRHATYKTRFHVNSDVKFKIMGSVRFTLLPKNTFEEVGFIISNQSGKVQVLKSGHKNLLPTKIMHMRTGAYIKGY